MVESPRPSTETSRDHIRDHLEGPSDEFVNVPLFVPVLNHYTRTFPSTSAIFCIESSGRFPYALPPQLAHKVSHPFSGGLAPPDGGKTHSLGIVIPGLLLGSTSVCCEAPTPQNTHSPNCSFSPRIWNRHPTSGFQDFGWRVEALCRRRFPEFRNSPISLFCVLGLGVSGLTDSGDIPLKLLAPFFHRTCLPFCLGLSCAFLPFTHESGARPRSGERLPLTL